jgi:replicative DNA helicase
MQVVPHDIEAEKALLGALLVNNDSINRIAGLKAEYFFDPLHAQIFETISRVIAARRLATPATLQTFFDKHEPITDGLTVATYLVQLAAASRPIDPRKTSQRIYDASLRRQAIEISKNLFTAAQSVSDDIPIRQKIDAAVASLDALTESGRSAASGPTGFDEVITRTIEMANRAYFRSGGLSGLSSGLRDLDRKLGGLMPSNLIVIGGCSSMGKTALATHIAYYVASKRIQSREANTSLDPRSPEHDGAVVAYFSLETQAEQLCTRILAERAEIPSDRIMKGLIDEDEFTRLVAVSATLKHAPLYIDSSGRMTVEELARRAHRIKREKGLGLVVIDYLQLIQETPSRTPAPNREQVITKITMALKALAMELGVPIIAVSQISRFHNDRDDKRPQLHDLRESGAIEHDADVVIFIYREDYYLERSVPPAGTVAFMDWQVKMNAAIGQAELIIRKHRLGPIGTVRVGFESQYHRFYDFDAIPTSAKPGSVSARLRGP